MPLFFISLEEIILNAAMNPEDVLIEKISLNQAIDKLSDREALVIKLRYFHGLTQQRVSRILEVSQVQVSRIEKKAISSLHKLLE